MEKGDPSVLLLGMQTGAATGGKQYGDISKKLKMDLPLDTAIPLLGIYLKEPKTVIQENISTPVFTVALFTTAKIWKQPKCPSVDEWVKQLSWVSYPLPVGCMGPRMAMNSAQHKIVNFLKTL